ncbi:MAG: hypothetical protein KAR06_12915 [Deltaproteobacteria bacterium]|nr:hypothetical protein [Deltaproteobacteria bacterium]
MTGCATGVLRPNGEVVFDGESYAVTLRARVKLHVSKKALSSKAVVLASSPDSIRVDVLGPGGQPVIMMAANGKSCDYVDGGVLLECSATSTIFSDGFLSSKELASILLGRITRDVIDDCFNDWKVIRTRGRITGVSKYSGGSVVVTVTTVNSMNSAGRVVPTLVIVKTRGDTLKVEYLEVETDVEIESWLFQLS